MKLIDIRPALAAALALTVISPLSTAQERQLEEIVVTAQKRAQSSQDVPLALSVISSDLIDKIGITQTQDLVKLSPSLSVGIGDNKNNSGFRLRGIGTNVFSVGVEQSVAVIIDDVSTVLQGQSIGNLVDIERIEVLRGPQSTLFGKSASAGVVSVVTKAPSDVFEGSIEATLTDDDETRVLASVSGPIGDSLGYRITGHWQDRDGFINNLTTGEDVNGEESKGLRGKLRWDISDSIDATLSAYVSEDESTCCALTWFDLDPTALVFGFVPDPVAPGITPSDTNTDFRSDDGPVDKTENTGMNLRFNIGLGDFNLTSISAIDNWEYANDGDVDFSNADVAGALTGGAQSGGIASLSNNETDFVSQEFRLSSPSYDNFDYVVGLYYADAETNRTFFRAPIITSDWAGTVSTESIALFGQATFRFSEATSLTAGLRWNDEEISVNYVNNATTAAPDPAISEKADDSEVLGNVSIQHFLSDDTMLYARYAQGYKGQAYDVTSGFTQLKADNPVSPETSDAYEIGIKSTFMDGRVKINAAAFFTEYEGYQAQSTRLLLDGSLLVSLNNVGSLETQGLEIEGAALIGEHLSLTFGAAYIDATIAEFLDANCYPGQGVAEGCVGGFQDISGGELPNSPEFKYSLVADYQIPLAGMPFDGFVTTSWVWQDEINFDLVQNPLTVQDSYGVLDISLGITESADDRYRVTLFVNNLTDENYRSGVGDLRQLYGGRTALTNVFSRNSQRYVGLRAKYSF